jgi:hypothetical protein
MPPAPRAPGEHGEGSCHRPPPPMGIWGRCILLRWAVSSRTAAARLGIALTRTSTGYFNLKQPLAAHAGSPRSPLNRGCHPILSLVSPCELGRRLPCTLSMPHASPTPRLQIGSSPGEELGVGHPKNTALRQGANTGSSHECACAPMSASKDASAPRRVWARGLPTFRDDCDSLCPLHWGFLRCVRTVSIPSRKSLAISWLIDRWRRGAGRSGGRPCRFVGLAGRHHSVRPRHA